MTTKRQRTIRLPVDVDARLLEAVAGSSVNAFIVEAVEQRIASDGVLETAIRDAVAAARWLTSTDRPAIDLAAHQARSIDEKTRTRQPGLFADDDEKGSSATYDRDVLFRMLDALGLSPRGRRDLNIEDFDEVDEIATILNLTR